jgi:Adenine-specific methyltransferase EcoRI
MAKSLNNNLHKAKEGKNDEFYTELNDIEKELRHYKKHFKGKTVFCNCDDPRVSNFFHYFSYNFEALGLKKLITTCYKNQDRDLFSTHNSESAIYLEYTGDKNGDRIPNPEEIGIVKLKGDGDFRSAESIELLKEADIVVTNPPFSLFREYIAQLIEYDKKFLIIGNINSLSYREIYKSIKENKLWIGYNCARHFKRPDGSLFEAARSYWYTNLDIAKRHDDFILYKTYLGNENEYTKYENFDAINIDRAEFIPIDYKGIMGVPITFLDKYNPDQFEIIGLGISNSGIEVGVQPYKEEHKKFRKEIQKRGAVDGDLYFVKNGEVEVPYARILIKNKRI